MWNKPPLAVVVCYGAFILIIMNKYLVALSVGGLMELPDFTYSDYDVINANSRKEAVDKYNKKHNCSYFYGTCLAEKIDGKINVLNKKVTYEKVEFLNAV